MMAQTVKNLPEKQETQVWSRSPGGGNGNLLQYSCLENSMDGGAWQVHGVAKSQTTEWLTLSLSFTPIKKKTKQVFTFLVNGQNSHYAMSAYSIFIELEVELLKKMFYYLWVVCEGKGTHIHDILLELQI